MRLSEECANFTLNTLDSTNTTQPYNAEYNNIDMRNILGDMYDKYDKFALICTSISFGNSSVPAINSINQQQFFKISGLSFYNAVFINSKPTSSATFASVFYIPQSVNNFGSSMLRVCFNKPTPIVNLKITSVIMLTRAAPTFNTTFIMYQFVIYGLYDD